MKLGGKVLGLAVGQKSILVAEVSAKGDKPALTRVGEFVFPEGQSLSTPEKLGTSLQQFLKSKRFSTKDVVIGLPAKRLVTRRKEVPAASVAIAASTLRLQAEGEFSSELDNLVMDFAGTTSTSEPTTVLLVATNKVVIDECQLMAQSAGLRVKGITSTGAALGRATSRLPGGNGWVLNLGQAAAELVVQHGADPAHLRHLSTLGGADDVGALAGEIRRTMASIPQNGTPQTLAIWNSPGNDDPQSLLEQRLSIPVTSPGLGTLLTTETEETEGYAPAVALALIALEPAGLPLDFLHSRLAAPKAPLVSRGKQIAIAVGVLLIALIAADYIYLNMKSNQLANIKSQIASRQHIWDQAKADIKRYDDAEAWIPKGPRYVAVLKDLTYMFPQTGIWATHLQYKQNSNTRDSEGMIWELQGQAIDQSYAQQLRDNMMNDAQKRFEGVFLTQTSGAEASTKAVNFTIRFSYMGGE